MDFDGDGKLDLVSGSYDPGELYLFRGLGGGKFSPREVIKDNSGKPILKVPNQKQAVESFGSWMTLVDWEDDGDLDILVGTFDGMIFLRRNEGSRAKPRYSVTNEWLKAGSKVLRVPGGEHANPVVADWDGDGRWDLVVGSGDGGVYWYRNTGQQGHPQFDAPVTLVPKHEGSGYGEVQDPDQEPRPGIRAQIAVVDYDGDGKLDLLLGDFCTYLHLKKDLTPEQRQKFSSLQARQEKVTSLRREMLEGLRGRFKASMKDVPSSEWYTTENQAKWQKMYVEMKYSPPFQTLTDEYESLQRKLGAYVEKRGLNGSSPDVAHGFVWFFQRK